MENIPFEDFPSHSECLHIKYSHYIKHNYFSTQPGKRGSVLEFLNFITLPKNRMNKVVFCFFLKFNFCTRLWMLSCLIRNQPGYFTSESSCPKASNWLADSMTKPQWLYCVRPESNHTRNPITKCSANPHYSSSGWAASEGAPWGPQPNSGPFSSLPVWQLYTINALPTT